MESFQVITGSPETQTRETLAQAIDEDVQRWSQETSGDLQQEQPTRYQFINYFGTALDHFENPIKYEDEADIEEFTNFYTMFEANKPLDFRVETKGTAFYVGALVGYATNAIRARHIDGANPPVIPDFEDIYDAITYHMPIAGQRLSRYKIVKFGQQALNADPFVSKTLEKVKGPILGDESLTDYYEGGCGYGSGLVDTSLEETTDHAIAGLEAMLREES